MKDFISNHLFLWWTHYEKELIRSLRITWWCLEELKVNKQPGFTRNAYISYEKTPSIPTHSHITNTFTVRRTCKATKFPSMSLEKLTSSHFLTFDGSFDTLKNRIETHTRWQLWTHMPRALSSPSHSARGSLTETMPVSSGKSRLYRVIGGSFIIQFLYNK